MDSTETPGSLGRASRRRALELARASISHGLAKGRALPLVPERLDAELASIRACFVTLFRRGQLRGCIGSLEARRALAVDIAENAYAAAFRDPRFYPVEHSELAEIRIHLSLLTPAESLPCTSEEDLLRQLIPGVDGVILREGAQRGTFLPSVWESLPDPGIFLAQLKRKAGLPSDYWSESLQFSRYRAEMIHESEDVLAALNCAERKGHVRRRPCRRVRPRTGT